MASGERNYPGKDESVIQTYWNTFTNNIFEEEESTSMAVNEIGNDKLDIGSVTYFIGDEGNYYYQPSDVAQNFISLDNSENTEKIGQNCLQLPDEELQTVALVPTETGVGEINYILVVQEDTQTLDNIDKKVEQQEEGNVKYTLNEEGIGGERESTAIDVEEPQLESEKSNNDEILGKYKRNKITCNICNFTTNKGYILLRHMNSHSEERPYKCSVCERSFKRLTSLQNHLNNHNGVKPFICKYCHNQFTTSSELVRHVRYIHTHEKPHKCKECDYASVEMSKLRRHVRSHTGERPYQCPHCTYASLDTFKLKRHLRSHTGEKPYKCDNCDMCFAQPASLKSHTLKYHASMKPFYSCDQCPASYRRKINLLNHVRKMHSEYPLNCNRCEKMLPDLYNYELHKKTNECEKNLTCNACPYVAKSFRYLQLHMANHAMEKRHFCDKCDKSFKQEKFLHHHENLFHNPDYVPRPRKEKTHTCSECKRNFAHKGNLNRHLAVHGPKLSQQEPPLEHGGQIMINFNNEDRGDEGGHLNLNKEGDGVWKPEEIVTASETDDQQYMILEVIQLYNIQEQQAVVAPEYGENEVQEELSFNQI